MIPLEKLKLTGKLNIVVRDENGTIKDEREVDNLVVTAGLAFIASRMKDATKAAMTHMGVGISTQAAAAADTALITALGARVTLTSTTVTSVAPITAVYVGDFAAGAATQGAITEAGIFNALTGGDMLCRTVFSVINKGLQDTMKITWTITLAAV